MRLSSNRGWRSTSKNGRLVGHREQRSTAGAESTPYPLGCTMEGGGRNGNGWGKEFSAWGDLWRRFSLDLRRAVRVDVESSGGPSGQECGSRGGLEIKI